MATYTWRVSSGDFGTPADWTTDGFNPASSAPGAGDVASFTSVGGTITGSGAVTTLSFLGASWTLTGQVAATTAIVNASTLTVSGAGTATLGGSLSAGFSGGTTATVNVIGGGQLVTTGAGAGSTFGASGGDTGSLTVATRGIAGFAGALLFGVDGGTGSGTVDAGLLTVGGVLELGAGQPGGTGGISVQDGGELVLQGAANAGMSYLQLGASAGTGGFVQVNGVGSVLLVSNNSGAVGLAGTGGLGVSNGAIARFATSNNALNPALAIGVLASGAGTVSVAGAGSSLTASGTIAVGGAGRGTLNVLAGASATSLGFTAAQAALAVASRAGGVGTLTIDGSGSQLTASGQAVIGGNNTGSGLTPGGIGTVAVTNGGTLQTLSLTIAAGSSLTVDGASAETVYGDLAAAGSLVNAGTLDVTGVVTGAGLQLYGGFAAVGALSSATVAFTGPSATLRVYALSGTSTINGLQYGDRLDLAGITAARLTGNTVLTTAGSLALGAAPAGSQYQTHG